MFTAAVTKVETITHSIKHSFVNKYVNGLHGFNYRFNLEVTPVDV